MLEKKLAEKSQIGIRRKGISMRVVDNTLILNKHDLESILVHIGLCAECESHDNGKVEKMNFIGLFKDELESTKWLNDFEDVEYDKIEIILD